MMSAVLMKMPALGGIGVIEIVIGATALLALIAIVCFFIGDKRERAAAKVAAPADELEIAPKQEPEPKAEPQPPVPAPKVDEPDEPEALEPVEKSEPKSVLPDLPQLDSPPKVKDAVWSALPKVDGKADEAEPEEDNLERKFIENKLQRIADKRAEEKQDEPEEMKVYPKGPPTAKPKEDLPDSEPAETEGEAEEETETQEAIAEIEEVPEPKDEKPALPSLPKMEETKPLESEEEKPSLPPLPKKEAKPEDEKPAAREMPPLPEEPTSREEKPELPELPAKSKSEEEPPTLPDIPKPVDEKLADEIPGSPDSAETAKTVPPPLPQHSKSGGDLPPLPGSASLEDEADLQTLARERES